MKSFTTLPATLDWIVNTTAPPAIAIGGVTARVVYAGLGALSTQLWRINIELTERRKPPKRNRRRWLSIASAGLVFVLIQFAPARGKSNAPIDSARTVEAKLDVPSSIEAILSESCKDCHSNETHWPWFAGVAPFSWMIASDVQRARQALNFSEWPVQDGLKPVVPIRRLTAVCADVESGLMPPAAYTRMHPAARLTAMQVEELCDWTGDQARLLRSEARLRRAAKKNLN